MDIRHILCIFPYLPKELKMAYILIIIGAILCVIGLLGSVIPILPGLPVSWIGLLLLYFIPGVEFDYLFLGITLGITILLVVLSYTIPAQGTKRFGGSRAGAIGTTVGLLLGIFFPFGILIGPFVGAFLGEIVFNRTTTKRALKAAFGSFLGFLAGTFINSVAAFVFLCLFIYKVWHFSSVIF